MSTDSPSVNVMRAEPLQRARRPPAAPAPRSLVGFLFGVSVSLVLLTATITYVFLSVHSAHENGPPILASPSPSDARTPVSPEPLPELQQQQQKQQQDAPLRPPPPPSPTAIEVVQAVTWPAVSIVAIIAVFLIARQAIAGERNVEISWKVTEKVSGRVVITKVKTPAAKAARAANKAA